MKIKFRLLSIVAVCCLLPTGRLVAVIQGNEPKHPNVLFICVDDLRPDIGCYGNTVAHSPNLDRLADKSMVFTKHYVTVPTCGASRASLLRGKLPQTTADLSNEAVVTRITRHTDEDGGPETFIEHLRRSGYYTVGIGKISHAVDGYVYPYTGTPSNQRELPNSWDEMLFDSGKWGTGWNAFFGYADGSNRQGRKGNVKPYEKADVPDNGYPDGLTASLAVNKLHELSAKKQPFFLGVGFFKPHLPFTAPAKYWDQINEQAIELTPSPNIPIGVNQASLHPSGEFNQYQAGEEKATLDSSLSASYSRKLMHAYYASVAYVDAQIGRVLNALKENGLDKNTIVVVWGDHGWHLGDHRAWGKHTLFDRALRSVFIVKQPGKTTGQHCSQIVSSVDIYPTLMELCRLAQPAGLDGESFAKLLTNPGDPSWRNTAYGYFNKGIALITPAYRYARYFREATPTEELFDHKVDPYENRNIVQEQPEVVHQLKPLWKLGNTGLYDEK